MLAGSGDEIEQQQEGILRAHASMWASEHKGNHSRPQSPRSFWSAPRIETSGRDRSRKSANHGLPALVRSLRNLNNNGYYRLQKWAAIALARDLVPARGLDPWRRPKGSWALGTRMKGNVLPWIVYIIGHYLWPNFSLRVKRILGFIRGIRSLESLPILCDNSGRILLRCAVHQLRYLLCVTLHEDNMATECCREPEYLSVV